MKKKYCTRLQKSFGVVKQCKQNENFILSYISKMRGNPVEKSPHFTSNLFRNPHFIPIPKIHPEQPIALIIAHC